MSSFRRLLPLLTLALALLPAASASAATPGVNVSNVTYSGDPYVGDPSTAARTWQDLTDSGVSQVRTFVQWSSFTGAGRQIELDKYRLFVDKARARGLTVLLTVTGDANTMATPAAYARVVGDLASHLRGSVAGYEVWNEPDLNQFWLNGPQPADYTELLKAAYPAIKKSDPGALVLVGGLVGNDFDFVEKLYDHGAKGSFDAVAVHTDTGCGTTDPTEYYREPSGRIGRFSFTGYREVRATMLAHGDDKPIWMSEIGWSTTSAICNRGSSAGQKPGGVSRDQQAAFLTKAYGCMANDSYLQRADWFNLHDVDTGSPEGAFNFGLITDAFTRKPAFGAMQKAASRGPISCGGQLDSSAPTVRFEAPTENAQYLHNLELDIRATDDKAVKDIFLLIDGEQTYIPVTRSGNTARAVRDWTMAKNLSYGPHTLTARATDEAKNEAIAKVRVVHVGGGAYKVRIPTRVKLKVSKASSGKLKARGRVVASMNVGRTLGMVNIKFERKSGKKWVKLARIRKNAQRSFRVSYRPSKRGKFRVTAAYAPKTGFKASKARVYGLRF